jgi:hypothetical protein
VIRPLYRFEVVGGAKWSMNALVCAIPTMRISTGALGKTVRNAEVSGRHVMTKLMRKIQSIGQNIERWERDEVQIPGTKIALERTILDALIMALAFALVNTQSTFAERRETVLKENPVASAEIPDTKMGDTYIIEYLNPDNPQSLYSTERKVVSIGEGKITVTAKNVKSKTGKTRTLQFTSEWNLLSSRNPDGNGFD